MDHPDQRPPLDDGGLIEGAGPAAPQLPQPPPPADPRSLAAVAPTWHTIALLALYAGLIWLSADSARETPVPSRVPRIALYVVDLAIQWSLFGFIWWGLRSRGVSIGSVLSYRWKGWSGVWRCALLAVACWLALFAGIGQALDTVGIRDAEQARRVFDLIAPRGPLEVAIWTVASLTAGFQEEIMFRGYLQRQFTAWTRNHLAGIALSAIIFGAGHLYQGVGAAALIAIIGLGFSLTAYATRSLVPGVVAHAWQDLLYGFTGRG